MPCRDYYDDHPQAYFRDVTEPALKKQISFAESALCATLNALELQVLAGSGGKGDPDKIYDLIDFEEAGITQKELREWRKRHAELDKKHRERELAEAKKTALAKLSPIEKKALGIK